MGLRKGEILGLKFDDFDTTSHTLTISRQITANPLVEKGSGKVLKYRIAEKEPKTENSYRTLRVPEAILEQVQERKKEVEEQKKKLGKQSDKLFVRENRSKGRNERSRLWWNNLNIWK